MVQAQRATRRDPAGWQPESSRTGRAGAMVSGSGSAGAMAGGEVVEWAMGMGRDGAVCSASGVAGAGSSARQAAGRSRWAAVAAVGGQGGARSVRLGRGWWVRLQTAVVKRRLVSEATGAGGVWSQLGPLPRCNWQPRTLQFRATRPAAHGDQRAGRRAGSRAGDCGRLVWTAGGRRCRWRCRRAPPSPRTACALCRAHLALTKPPLSCTTAAHSPCPPAALALLAL